MKQQGILFCFGVFLFMYGTAQSDALSIRSMNAPSSPVFNLMGVALTDIERPKDPSDVYVSVRNATDGFTTFPKCYSLELAPMWVTNGRNYKYSDFESSKARHSVPQSWVISFGTRVFDMIDTSRYSQIGVGTKFTICRGRLSEEYQSQKKELDEALEKYNTAFADWINSYEASNAEYKALEAALLSASGTEEVVIKAEMLKMKTDAYERDKARFAKLADEARAKLKKLDFRRVGFLLDVSGALVIDFPTNKAGYSKIGRAGLWLTAGYAPPKWKGIEFLAIVRYLYSRNAFEFDAGSDSVFVKANMHYFDAGVKVNFVTWQGRVSMGFEGVARVSNVQQPPYWRYAFNLNFQALPNKVISFTVGQNYTMKAPDSNLSRALSKDNLVIALNLLLGFGNERPANN